MRILTIEDYQKMPWKNGLGITYEIAKKIDGDDFIWRVSMACVANDGEFSYFMGKKRLLSILSMGRMALTINGKNRTLRRGQVLAFDGSDTVFAYVKQALMDINLIYLPKVRATMRWCKAGQAMSLGRGRHFCVASMPSTLHLPKTLHLDTHQTLTMQAGVLRVHTGLVCVLSIT